MIIASTQSRKIMKVKSQLGAYFDVCTSCKLQAAALVGFDLRIFTIKIDTTRHRQGLLPDFKSGISFFL
jgi:hypothetical protein